MIRMCSRRQADPEKTVPLGVPARIIQYQTLGCLPPTKIHRCELRVRLYSESVVRLLLVYQTADKRELRVCWCFPTAGHELQ